VIRIPASQSPYRIMISKKKNFRGKRKQGGWLDRRVAGDRWGKIRRWGKNNKLNYRNNNEKRKNGCVVGFKKKATDLKRGKNDKSRPGDWQNSWVFRKA